VQLRLYLASADCVAPHRNYDGSLAVASRRQTANMADE
jgi:hypothetical protein